MIKTIKAAGNCPLAICDRTAIHTGCELGILYSQQFEIQTVCQHVG
jgi:hypothetical protein